MKLTKKQIDREMEHTTKGGFQKLKSAKTPRAMAKTIAIQQAKADAKCKKCGKSGKSCKC